MYGSLRGSSYWDWEKAVQVIGNVGKVLNNFVHLYSRIYQYLGGEIRDSSSLHKECFGDQQTNYRDSVRCDLF